MITYKDGILTISTDNGDTVELELGKITNSAQFDIVVTACKEDEMLRGMVEGLENELEDERATIEAMKEENDLQSRNIGKLNDLFNNINRASLEGMCLTS